MKKGNPKSQAYLDGVAHVYGVRDDSEPGGWPTETQILIATLPYHARTVGMSRYWAAKQAQVQIDHVIRCPLISSAIQPDGTHVRRVRAGDLVILRDGLTYRIEQIQYPEDTMPPAMDLSLSVSATEVEVRP